MLEIKNLHVMANEKEILKGLDLTLYDHEIHVLMGPNGAGKSTVCKAILHHPSYTITSGSILFQQEDITKEKTNVIASKGLYYMSQNPIEIEGITNMEMLRTALVEKNKTIDIMEFRKKCNEICEKLHVPKSFLLREVNSGMSGGERKKNELFGMWLLKPNCLLLDEIDSGLDVDAIKTVAENLLEYHKETNCSMLVITHQQQLIHYLKPDKVHIMKDGKIIESGPISLAEKILKEGFSGTSNVSGESKDE